jgi:hypothetical protein
MISKTNSGKNFQGHRIEVRYWGEFRSKSELFGLPLIHVALGIDPRTGFFRVAKGIIAIGDAAVGFLALGRIALGGIAISGLGMGLIAIGGLVLGAFTIGRFSAGLLFALGGIAFSLTYAIGGLRLAKHFIAANGVDKELVKIIEQPLRSDGRQPASFPPVYSSRLDNDHLWRRNVISGFHDQPAGRCIPGFQDLNNACCHGEYLHIWSRSLPGGSCRDIDHRWDEFPVCTGLALYRVQSVGYNYRTRPGQHTAVCVTLHHGSMMTLSMMRCSSPG